MTSSVYKTSLQRDPHGPATEYAPPNFNEYNLIEAEEKFGIADPVDIDQFRLEAAIVDVVNELKTAGISMCKPLTAQESVFGNEIVYPMNLNTSAGFPYRGKKKKWIVENTDYISRFNSLYEQLDTAPLRLPAGISFKDEIRPLRKNGLPRAFVIMGIDYVGVARMLGAEFDAKIADTLATTGIGIGHNYLQGGWQTLLNRHGRKMYHLDGDYSNWDGKLPPAVIKAIARVRSQFMPSHCTNKIMNLYMDLAFCPLVYHDGTVRMRFGGIPSGHASTATDNSIGNKIILKYTLWMPDIDRFVMQDLDELSKRTLLQRWEGKYRKLKFVDSIYGDDNIISSDEQFDVSLMVENMKQIGMTYTGADKGLPRWKSLDQVEFLKFSTVIINQRWLAYRPGLDRVLAILAFRKEPTVEHFIARARMAYMLAYNHPDRDIVFDVVERMTRSYVYDEETAENVFAHIVDPFFHVFMMRGVHLRNPNEVKDANVTQNFQRSIELTQAKDMAKGGEKVVTTTKVVEKPKGQRPPRGRRARNKQQVVVTEKVMVKPRGPKPKPVRKPRRVQQGKRAFANLQNKGRGLLAQLNSNVMHSSSTNFIVEACSPWEQIDEMCGIPDGIGGSVIVQKLATTNTVGKPNWTLTASPPEVAPPQWNLMISQTSLPGIEYVALRWGNTNAYNAIITANPTFTPWQVFARGWANGAPPAVRTNVWIPIYDGVFPATPPPNVVMEVYFAQDVTVADIESLASKIRLIGRSTKSVLSASALHNEGMIFFAKHPMEHQNISASEVSTMAVQLMKLGFKATPEMMRLVPREMMERHKIFPDDVSQVSFSEDEDIEIMASETTVDDLQGLFKKMNVKHQVNLPEDGTKRARQLKHNLRTETMTNPQVLLAPLPSTPNELQNFDRNGFTSHAAKHGGLTIATFTEPITGQEMNAESHPSDFIITSDKEQSTLITQTPLFSGMSGFNHYWDTQLYQQISTEGSVTISTNAYIEFVPALESQVAAYASKSAPKDDMALKFVANIQRSIKHGFNSNANDGGGLFGMLESWIRKIPVVGDIAGGIFGGLRGTANKLAFG